MNYLASSFSLQMLPQGGELKIIPISTITIREWLDMGCSRIGHEGTARRLSKELGVEIKVDRTPIKLEVGDQLQVAQPIGTRLVPGTEIEEPELTYFLVVVKPKHHCPELSSYRREELEKELARRPKWSEEELG